MGKAHHNLQSTSDPLKPMSAGAARFTDSIVAVSYKREHHEGLLDSSKYSQDGGRSMRREIGDCPLFPLFPLQLSTD